MPRNHVESNCRSHRVKCAVIVLIGGIMAATGCRNGIRIDPGDRNTSIIRIAAGPEDFVVDLSTGAPQLIVSCGRHRQRNAGAIYAVDLATHQVRRLTRSDENENPAFRPHGIDLAVVNGVPLLYAISHELGKHGDETHLIRSYEIRGSILIAREVFEHESMWSPNDVAVLDDGSFFVTNDYGQGWPMFWNVILNKRHSTITHRKTDGSWEVIARNLPYSNGIAARDNKVYVANSMGENIVMIEKTNAGWQPPKEVVNGLHAVDNLTWHGNDLVAASHDNPIMFANHANMMSARSPSSVRQINLKSSIPTVIYQDDGTQLSGCSVALIYKNKLYLGQVFEPYIVVKTIRPE